MPTGRTPGPFVDRFWRHVEKTEACWNWTSARRTNGYGQVKMRMKRYGVWASERAHRIAWMLFHGDPGKLLVLHTCDNRRCCNPEHLFLGTTKDNVDDMVRKGRAAWQKSKTMNEK